MTIYNSPLIAKSPLSYLSKPSGNIITAPYVTSGSGVTNLYVDVINGNDSNSGTSLTNAFATLQKANSIINSLVNNGGGTPLPSAAAGYVINVAPGVYPQVPQSGQSGFCNSLFMDTGGGNNSPNGYVVWRSIIPGAAKIIPGTGSLTSGTLIRITAPYIIIDGFDIDGQFAVGNCVACDKTQYGQYAYGGFFNKQGIPHHIIVINCEVHDGQAAGVGFSFVDYLQISGNVVYNCASMSQTNTSGITVYQAQANSSFSPTIYDSYTSGPLAFSAYQIQITQNVCYNNTLRYNVAGVTHSDGNGIICDDWLNTQHSGYQGSAYTNKGLVQGNLCYNNGGAGIACYYSQNVTINKNTTVGNWQDPLNNSSGLPNGDTYVYACLGGVSVTNNIMVAANAPYGGISGGNFAFLMNSVQPYATGGSQVPYVNNNIVYPAITVSQYVDTNSTADFANFSANNRNGTNPNIEPGLISSSGLASISFNNVGA